MRGFPGFINQKLGGATPPALPNAGVVLPKAPPAAPALPQAPLLNRPIVVVPVAVVRPPVVVLPTVRPVTLATITRNLQAALAPEAPPVAPTTKGFPGFVSRNFNQVSQHQPGASNEKHLSGLANLFTPPTTRTPERRQAPRPVADRPKVATPQPSVPFPAPALKKPETPKAPALAPKVAQASPKPRAAEPAKPSPAPVKPQAATPPTAPPAPQPPLARKPETAKVPAPAKPPAPAAAVPTSSPSPTSPSPTSPSPTPANPVPVPTGAKQAAESKTAPEPAPQNELKVEARAPLLENQPARQTEPFKLGQEARNQDRVENQASLTKTVQPSPAAGPRPADSEKLAQTRPEASEVKVGEVQRSQVNALQAPGAREQMTLVQENGAGLSAGGGFGSGGGGGQQGRQRRRQDEQDGPEQIGTSEMLGGDDHVEWWLLRGEENLRALSSELREAMFFLRTPQRRLGEDFEQARKRQKAEQQAPKQPVQTEIREREEHPQTGDRVEMEAIELCLSCGNDLGGLDPRRCPVCLCQAAQATLELLQADPRFLAYRVFLTACRQPVASRAVYRLRDFASLPSGAYCVQAA